MKFENHFVGYFDLLREFIVIPEKFINIGEVWTTIILLQKR